MTRFQPMLACREKPDLSKLKYPVLVSPKLDGIRALIIDGVVMSRSLKPIPNRHVQKLFGHVEYNGYDGELIVGSPTDKNCLQNTNSGVMTIEGEPDVVYHVFDMWDMPRAAFESRIEGVYTAVDGQRSMVCVHHEACQNFEDVERLEAEYVRLGYEGLMIRSLGGLYKHGRTTMKEATFFKLKRWEDDEAVIIDVRELEHNDNEKTQDAFGRAKRSSHKANKRAGGTMGELVVSRLCKNEETGAVEDIDDVQFNIGTGFSKEQRAWFWVHREALVGEVICFKHFNITGVVNRPRNPVFKSLRSKIDL